MKLGDLTYWRKEMKRDGIRTQNKIRKKLGLSRMKIGPDGQDAFILSKDLFPKEKKK